ncbi:hypothetical protein GX50_03668 [[Emmonsia] crescens]|uniref:Uncharacterized protein n=1 Tax=[Emmonsia] crescens TaxID=73230 RepID=A0A2B7ZJI3_9EURO|nr:hypothetical protein GX50_03668 [Emmonsia crescens]
MHAVTELRSRGKTGSKATKREIWQGTERKAPESCFGGERRELECSGAGEEQIMKRPVQAELIGLRAAEEESGHGKHSKLRNADFPTDHV